MSKTPEQTVKNREASRLRMKARYDAGHRQNPETLWSAWLRYRYGITPEQWQSLYDSQEGLCGICGQPQGAQRLCVDHDHSTGAVRGLLCDFCNRKVGRVEALRSGEYRVYEEWLAREAAIPMAGGNYRDLKPSAVTREWRKPRPAKEG